MSTEDFFEQMNRLRNHAEEAATVDARALQRYHREEVRKAVKALAHAVGIRQDQYFRALLKEHFG